MNNVDGIVGAHVVLTQARVQTEIATRLLKVALETGAPQQMLELVQQAAEAATASMQAAVAAGTQRLDLLA